MNRRGQDAETPVEITLEEAHAGTVRTVRMDNDRRIEVKVPAGVKTGSRVRVAGEGHLGMGSGPAGDLFLIVNVAPHARFERKGDDLIVEAPVPYLDAILGGEVQIQTIEGGKIALKVPELTQNGRQFRLAGKGMAVLGKPGQRGDLIVRVRVVMPDRLGPEERQHIEALRELHHAPAAT
jgi:DnaJ-class molecular chaperone